MAGRKKDSGIEAKKGYWEAAILLSAHNLKQLSEKNAWRRSERKELRIKFSL